MAYGLQVFDSSGNLEIDVSSRLNRRIASFNYSLNPGANLFYNVPGLVLDGTWAVLHSSILTGPSIDDLSVHATIYNINSGFYLRNDWMITVSGRIDIVRF